MKTALEKYNLIQKKKFQNYINPYIERNEEINWSWLSRITWIDINFVLKWKNKPWNEHILSNNPAITKEDKDKTKHLFAWQLPKESVNTMEEYILAKSKIPERHIMPQTMLRMRFSMENKNILKDVELYPDFQWDWEEISTSKYLNEEFIFKYKNKLDFEFLSANEYVCISFIQKTLDTLPWELPFIILNPKFKECHVFFFIKEQHYKDKEIMKRLCQQENISINFIMSYFGNYINSEALNYRTDVSAEDILNYPNVCWDWWVLCRGYSTKLSKSFLLSHPDVIKEEFYMFIKEEFYMFNSNLTVDDILHLHPNKIQGNFLLGTIEDKISFMRQYYAVRVISNAFFNCYWFIDYSYCRKRLNKRYDELFNVIGDENEPCMSLI